MENIIMIEKSKEKKQVQINKYILYELRKKALASLQMTPEEYQNQIQIIADELEV